MNGPYHYDQAERAEAAARAAATDTERTHFLMTAQYHATMAQTGAVLDLAQVTSDANHRDHGSESVDITGPDGFGWHEVIDRPFVPCDYIVDEEDVPHGPWGTCAFTANHPQPHRA